MPFFKSKEEQGPKVDFEHLPRHVAIIMDGNGRWAKRRGLPRTAGHAAGAERRVLLRHAPLHIALCVADLQQALIVGVVLLVGVDHRMSIRPLGEKLRITHRRHRPTPSALSWTR